MKVHSDFLDFFKALNKNHVDYVIVGAYAMAFHGVPRATGDIDVWIRPTYANGLALLSALKDFGFGSADISVEDILSGKIVQLGFPPVRIDLISDMDGLNADEIWASREPGRFGSEAVFYIGKEAFVKNKKASGRYRDLADLELLGEGTE